LTVLENFLNEFQGCLLVVSHDRYFMDKVVDELMVFEGEGKISWFNGNYTEYFLSQKEKQTEKAIPQKIQTKPNAQKINFNQKRELGQLEKELPKLQSEKEKLTGKLS